ncbi:retrovirus-related Pol polyprotein from transposon opus [Trichonephila clavipes]|nr:retrovirus-related Pol polyprotein from transposon opus [Trichonephila clavipes]
MRNLAPSKLEDDLLQTLWLQRLPANLQQVLSVCKAPLDELTQIADKKHEVSGILMKAQFFHCIETKGPPVHARTRRLNPERLAYLKREFGDLMRQGIIRPSKSSYASPIHFVKKSEGSWRIWGDFRRLNSVTIPDRYPLPHIHDFVSGLRDHESQKRDLDLVFSKLGEHGIIVNPQKCVFGQSELNFLGFLVSSNGISPLPEKIQFLKDFPLPKTVQELRRFLATLHFYHRFLKGAAEEQACLHDLVKNKVKRDNTPVVWNDVTKSAFESCKKLITNATALSFPAADARLSLMTDASDFAVGSVLQQHIEATVEPLVFFSRKLSATEKKYSTFDRELLSIYLSVKHFRHMLEGHILSSSVNLQLTFVTLRGSDNVVADTFSRISQINLLNSNDYSRLSEDQSSDLELQSLMGSATGLELRPMFFAHSDKSFYCDQFVHMSQNNFVVKFSINFITYRILELKLRKN